jgi:hypothetical protein
MEITSQSTSTSIGTMSSDASISRAAVNGSPTQAKIFPESEAAVHTVRSAKAHLAHQATADQTHHREKRGAVLGTCSKGGDFRECRGGAALEDGSDYHARFDQFDRKQTLGEDKRGTCEGIVREVMRRMDRDANGYPSEMWSAVDHMIESMNGDGADRTNTFNRIQAFQNNPTSLQLTRFRQSRAADMSTYGTMPETRVNAALGILSNLAPGGVAVLRLGIGRTGNADQTDSGHVLLVQRRPGSREDPTDLWTVFDPNNGVFGYSGQDAMQASLKNYMNTAYSELDTGSDHSGYFVAPTRVVLYDPPSAPGWQGLAATPDPTPAPDSTQLEPPGLAQLPATFFGASRSDL